MTISRTSALPLSTSNTFMRNTNSASRSWKRGASAWSRCSRRRSRTGRSRRLLRRFRRCGGSVHRGRHARRGDWRPASVRQCEAVDGLAGSCAGRALQRNADQAGRTHPDWECCRTGHADRIRMALSLSGTGGACAAGAQCAIANHIRAIAWKAQTRLCTKFRRLAGAGKHAAKIVAAIARELAGFIWDIARQTPVLVPRQA